MAIFEILQKDFLSNDGDMESFMSFYEHDISRFKAVLKDAVALLRFAQEQRENAEAVSSKPLEGLTEELQERVDGLESGQKKLLRMLLRGNFDFIVLGPAGTGKSHVIRLAADICRHEGTCMGVAATTWTAAAVLNGLSLHTWGGFGIFKENAQRILLIFYILACSTCTALSQLG